jgi:hypothetical protein
MNYTTREVYMMLLTVLRFDTPPGQWCEGYGAVTCGRYGLEHCKPRLYSRIQQLRRRGWVEGFPNAPEGHYRLTAQGVAWCQQNLQQPWFVGNPIPSSL